MSKKITDKAICEALNINQMTFSRWKVDRPELYKRIKESFDCEAKLGELELTLEQALKIVKRNKEVIDMSKYELIENTFIPNSMGYEMQEGYSLSGMMIGATASDQIKVIYMESDKKIVNGDVYVLKYTLTPHVDDNGGEWLYSNVIERSMVRTVIETYNKGE